MEEQAKYQVRSPRSINKKHQSKSASMVAVIPPDGSVDSLPSSYTVSRWLSAPFYPRWAMAPGSTEWQKQWLRPAHGGSAFPCRWPMGSRRRGWWQTSYYAQRSLRLMHHQWSKLNTISEENKSIFGAKEKTTHILITVHKVRERDATNCCVGEPIEAVPNSKKCPVCALKMTSDAS